jgi:hypothetical protein
MTMALTAMIIMVFIMIIDYGSINDDTGGQDRHQFALFYQEKIQYGLPHQINNP